MSRFGSRSERAARWFLRYGSNMEMDDVLTIARALGCQARLDTLRVVGAAGDGLRVVEVAQLVGVGEPTAHYHLDVLVRAGLLKRTRKGCRPVYGLSNTRYSILVETVTAA